MTTFLGDVIYNIEEEEYWEVCQHALKNPYEVRTDDENDEGGEAPSDDGEGSNSKSDNSSDNNSSDSGDSGDNKSNDINNEKSSSEDYNSQDSGNDRGEPLVIEKMKMWDLSMKTILTMMWTTMTEI